MADKVDFSPAFEIPAPSATGAIALRDTPGDCFGSSTIAFGTEVVKVVPGKDGLRTSIDAFWYECGGTAHTVTLLCPIQTLQVASEAAAGQTVINATGTPTSTDGSIIDASDFIVARNELGIFNVFKVASVSGRAITITASVGSADGSGLTTKILKGYNLWYYGSTGDHPLRQFRMPASTFSSWAPHGGRLCVSRANNEPLLIHSNNATATGYLGGPKFSYVKL